MSQTEEPTKRIASQSFALIFEAFGRRFQDDDVKAKFRDAGKAALELGKSSVDHFKPEKETGRTDKEDQQI